MKLDLQKFREVNIKRATEGFKTYDNVPLLFFTTALAGEVGELCNMIKKIERAKYGGLDAGTNHKAADITTDVLKEEIGGIFIYLDLLSSLVGVDLGEAILETFNSKSEKYKLIKFNPSNQK
jgi:NTP pyrophosphatase (non-canonical NTP hydrolase)